MGSAVEKIVTALVEENNKLKAENEHLNSMLEIVVEQVKKADNKLACVLDELNELYRRVANGKQG